MIDNGDETYSFEFVEWNRGLKKELKGRQLQIQTKYENDTRDNVSQWLIASNKTDTGTKWRIKYIVLPRAQGLFELQTSKLISKYC